MINSFKDPEQMQALVDSQYKTIIELSQKIQKLEQENKTLKEDAKSKAAFTGNSNIIKLPEKEGEIVKLAKTDQEVICTMQLFHIKNNALDRELTLEEARKVEIYSKILNTLNSKDDSKDAEFKKLSDEDLLKELENGAAKNQS